MDSPALPSMASITTVSLSNSCVKYAPPPKEQTLKRKELDHPLSLDTLTHTKTRQRFERATPHRKITDHAVHILVVIRASRIVDQFAERPGGGGRLRPGIVRRRAEVGPRAVAYRVGVDTPRERGGSEAWKGRKCLPRQGAPLHQLKTGAHREGHGTFGNRFCGPLVPFF